MDLTDTREKAVVIHKESKNLDLESPLTLRLLEKEFDIYKSSIARAVTVISDNWVVGKRGSPELLSNEIIFKTLKWIDNRVGEYNPPCFRELEQFLSCNISTDSSKRELKYEIVRINFVYKLIKTDDLKFKIGIST